jgi:phage shock protein A
MNIWAKMMTALRGGVNEAGESIVDSQALRILDQEVRDAAEGLKKSKDSLAEIMARQKLAEEKSLSLQNLVIEHEAYVVKALDKDNQSLAREIAEKIADLEVQQIQQQEAAEGYAESTNKLRTAIQQTERNIKQLKQQADTVKATENVQKAQAAVAQRHGGSNSKLRTAMDSLERIKEKQAFKEAQMAAASELAEDSVEVSLQTKMEKAGVVATGSNADDILERIKNKKP